MDDKKKPAADGPSAYFQLTVQQRKFVDVLVTGKTQSYAARKAGYAAKKAGEAGSRLMAQPLIRTAVEQRRMQATIDAGVEASAVLKRIVSIAKNAKAKHTDRLKADELLGKHLKLFTEKHEHAGAGGAPLPPPAAAPVILMTPETAKAIAKQLADTV